MLVSECSYCVVCRPDVGDYSSSRCDVLLYESCCISAIDWNHESYFRCDVVSSKNPLLSHLMSDVVLPAH